MEGYLPLREKPDLDETRWIFGTMTVTKASVVDPDPHHLGKLESDPHQSGKLDPDLDH